MPEPGTEIHIASSLLRAPQLFDGLCPAEQEGTGEGKKRRGGACTGGILRDLVLYAAWKNERVCELRLPDFCKMMGYDSSNLTRRCTEAEVEEIRNTGWPEEHIESFSNILGLALVRLVCANFILATKGATSNPARIGGSKIIKHVDVYEAKSTGTLLSFTLSAAILSQNRREFQTPILEEYLSLRTQSATRKENHPGHPDDAARRMYMRLTWLRQYHDYLVRDGRATDARNLLRGRDKEYQELVRVAGLAARRSYWPEKRVASELRKLLGRVGSMASLRLVPEVKGKDGLYEVTWETGEQVAARVPEVSEYTPTAEAYEPAPDDWGKAPAPVATRPARRATASRTPAAGAARRAPIVPGTPPAKKPKPTMPQPDRQKLKNQLDDAVRALEFYDTPAAAQAKGYVGQPELLAQHREQALEAVRAIKRQLDLH